PSNGSTQVSATRDALSASAALRDADCVDGARMPDERVSLFRIPIRAWCRNTTGDAAAQKTPPERG
ncbi:MAG: hypothetical protein ACREPU_06005, partial [Rhodanobacteraceae bacterium]